MRHILIVLGMCVAAIAVGAGLYLYGPADLNQAAVLTDTEATALGSEPLEAMTFAVIAEGQNAAEVTERKNYAVYAQDEFERLWEMAYGSDAPALPSIDFNREYVIGVFAGVKPTGGHRVEVTQVSDSSTARTVSIVLTTPGPDCVVTEAFTSPFQLVRVPLTNLELAREEQEVVASCR